MEENINNIYFLKDTLGKFRTELQKFISNPDQINNNVIALRNNILDLEKNVSTKEKSIVNQILNNNVNTFNPIANRPVNTKIRNFSSKNFSNKNTKKNFNETKKKKENSNSNLNSAKKNIIPINNIINTNNNNSILNNKNANKTNNNSDNKIASFNNNNSIFNKTFGSKNFSNHNLHTGNISNQNKNQINVADVILKSLYGEENDEEKNEKTFNKTANNRFEIFPKLNGVNDNYYDLAYKTKKKEIVPEYSSPHFENEFYKQKNFTKTAENETYKNMLLLRRPKDEINYMQKEIENFHKNKNEAEEIMQKNNIKTNKNKYAKVKRSVGSANYMDRSKLNKYSSINRNIHSAVRYDKNNAPIITNDEIGKGVLSMINRGLIPKTADLTPAFNRNGHPITLAKGNELKEFFAKNNKRDDIDLGPIDKTKYNIENIEGGNNFFITTLHNENNNQSMRDFINYNNVFYNHSNTHDTPHNNSNYKNENIVKSIDATPDYKNPSSLSNNENEKIFIKAITIKNKEKENDADIIRKENNETSIDKIAEVPTINKDLIMITTNNQESVKPEIKKNKYFIKMIIFKEFLYKENEDFREFVNNNEEKVGAIMYLIEHYQKLFRKLDIKYAEVELSKFANLAMDELQSITNKDMLLCLTEKDKKSKGFDNAMTFHTNLKEAFVIRIQKFYRMYFSRKNYKELKKKITRIRKLQRNYRLYRIYKISNIMIMKQRKVNLEIWIKMMEKFKENWPEYKKGKRIEIHINSMSYSYLRNCTMEKFSVRENNQLNRIINLLDPNVEIIYISPFEIADEVLSYYFSILSSLGVNDAKERFQIIVPDEISYFPPSFSLTQMLLFSDISLKKIRNQTFGKVAYIVPGVISKSDMNLSNYLEVPILMGESELTKTLFTKSGSKRVFELSNMAFPISAWDIRNEEEFYNSLIDLINKYISVNIWIFKMDSEVNGRGIAYFQMDKIKELVDLRKERMTGLIDEDYFCEEMKDYLPRLLPKYVEIITPNIYNNFKQFLSEFCEFQGVIESCPTNSLSGITGCPCISIFIEPDGNVELIGTYDKINHNFFRNVAVLCPQSSLPNLTLFWAIDLKFGYSDIISCIKFCEGIDSNSFNQDNSIDSIVPSNATDRRNTVINSNVNSEVFSKRLRSLSLGKTESNLSILKIYLESQRKFRFFLPVITHPEIANVKMRELVQKFRNELLVYDIEKSNGIVFNLPDIIQCGMFGVCGIAKNKIDLMKMFEKTVNLIKEIVTVIPQKDNKSYSYSVEKRTDIIDLMDLIGRIRYYIKND